MGCGNASWAVQHRTIRTPERKTASARGETSRRIISTADGLRGDAKGTDVKTDFIFFSKPDHIINVPFSRRSQEVGAVILVSA